MTRITFYFNADDRLGLACRLVVEKAWQQKLHTLVFTEDAHTTAQLDEHLWTANPLSFIPHCRCDAPAATATPIHIGASPDQLARHDLLINLTHQPPACLGRFERLIEIVTRDDADRAGARERYRFYQSRGYAIDNHDLAK